MQREKYPEIGIETEMKKSYLEYALSVIIGRALPDVRDGLKPVHRRVLFAMRELKNDWNRPYKKSARIVGDVIGKYHPHGDSAVYDAIVRMAQTFSLRYPLVNGQGNFGSVDGDPPAAMRYTEIRMMRFSHEMMDDLDKETVEFIPNYDETLAEPSVLPAKVPNLLVNGSSGIAVGMATNIPPHNLHEIVDAVKAVIDAPDISFEELCKLIPGPDFPTAGIIYGTNGIYSAYKTGRGVIKLRARAKIEKDKRTQRETIIITEIPYQVNKARLIEKTAELIRNKQIEGIKFVRDESDREGMRIAVALKKNQVAEVTLNQLYKHTQLETSFGIILLGILNKQPRIFSLKELLENFIIHRKEIITKRTIFDLNKAQARAHILEGLKVALENLDDVVSLIRASKSPAEAKISLVNKFSLTLIQAQAILDMRLQRLTGLEQEKIIEELKNILTDIERYREILSSVSVVEDIIKNELTLIQQEFGDDRRTEIVESTKEITLEDMIVEEDMVVSVTNQGYIKRTPVTLYKNQHRGGRGRTAMMTKDEDFIEHLFVASTHHTFLFFTNFGKVYWCKVYEIPLSAPASRGKAIVNLLNFEKEEKLATILEVPSFETGSYIIMATKNGLVKKTDIMAYSRPRAGGIKAVDLGLEDELIAVRITDGTMNIFLSTRMGKSIRFYESDVRPTGRTTKGVRGIRLIKDDIVVGMEVLSHGQTLFTATEHGYGKRTSIDEYPVQKRGGMGVITIKTSKRNGFVVAILLVEDEDSLMLVADTGKLIRISSGGISVISRNTQGIKLINLTSDDKLIGAVRVVDSEEHDEEHDE